MKDKILNCLKENGGKILLYILITSFGMLLIPVLADIEKFKIFIIELGIVGRLMLGGYWVFGIFVAKLVIDFLLGVENKNSNKKEQKKNKNGDKNA